MPRWLFNEVWREKRADQKETIVDTILAFARRHYLDEPLGIEWRMHQVRVYVTSRETEAAWVTKSNNDSGPLSAGMAWRPVFEVANVRTGCGNNVMFSDEDFERFYAQQ